MIDRHGSPRPFEIAGLATTLLTGVGIAASWGHLPSTVAVHWSWSGEPNGHLSRPAFLATVVILQAAILSLGRLQRGRALYAKGAAAMAFFIVVLLAGLAGLTSAANWAKHSWQEARGPLVEWGLFVLVLCIGGLMHWAFTPSPLVTTGQHASTLGLGDNETAVWVSGAKAPSALPLAFLLPLGVFALLLSHDELMYAVAVTALFIGIACFLFLSVTVTIGPEVLRIAYGPLGWPVMRLPIREIEGAMATHIAPMAHGGWGYRGSLRLFRRATCVVRGGPGILMDLSNGRTFALTVDDAETGAALLNDLIARGRSRALP